MKKNTDKTIKSTSPPEPIIPVEKLATRNWSEIFTSAQRKVGIKAIKKLCHIEKIILTII